MPYISPFSGERIDGIRKAVGQRMIELLDETPVKKIRKAKGFVRRINRYIATIESEVGQEVHRGALTFLAIEWRNSIGRK